MIVVEKNGKQKNANLITKTIVYRIEECEFAVYLWNCEIKECESGCGNLGVKIAHSKIELMRPTGLNEFKE